MKKVTRVFYISAIIALLFIIWGIIPKDILPNGNLDNVTSIIQGFLVDKFGWFYLLSATAFLGFAIYLIFSKYGNIKLGRPGDKPEYSYLTWFAMLFSAGMGIGLVFWGAAEPISHFHNPPFGEAETNDAAKAAMQYSFFHWGFHPWAIYATIALALAYFKFRKQAPGVVSAILEPLFGDRIKGGWGTAVDFIVVFATIFGVSTSLGLGAIQISGGLSFVTGIESTITLQLIIIAIVTVLYMTSAMTGLNRGIKYLSNANLMLALLLMLFVLFLGPTNFIMNFFTTTLGSYLQNLPSMSLRMTPFNEENAEWINGWTIFYWAWWIAWAPFVGTFIARVSRGRTIREFVLGVLLVPTIFGALWFSVFGGSAIHLEANAGANIMQYIESGGEQLALFAVLEQFPIGIVISIIAILLICTFFITSADSATFVLGMQTTGGSLDPANSVKFIWGIIQSSAAAVLLWQGGLNALQTASIIAAFPFAIIMLLVVISLVKSFRQEAKEIDLGSKRRG
ncbi:MAG: glycine betaine uptake BCCT transporter [Bacillota bacterium]|uniref:BCCT family transporter n=1 Tax=Virgibacillus salarius TaxID=447199 RepID=A0A941E1P2_9BACI|nr:MULTISPECIES: BCCT family transporter [Bacillaceae]MBR7798103.1 BCCT family transporter [Virgibacillus salarius]NAZ10812.1 BCCT family transporter [Agaribacter marinus]MCC2249655.1 BCCT family transporter [Virgibacillus sp. AGTR]MDY7044236.1 BCCT family transporter [Virgibacillus sp. M23]QRZ16825.1 BCCT family transporter [Virgibacillus sp. AGTR]